MLLAQDAERARPRSDRPRHAWPGSARRSGRQDLESSPSRAIGRMRPSTQRMRWLSCHCAPTPAAVEERTTPGAKVIGMVWWSAIISRPVRILDRCSRRRSRADRRVAAVDRERCPSIIAVEVRRADHAGIERRHGLVRMRAQARPGSPPNTRRAWPMAVARRRGRYGRVKLGEPSSAVTDGPAGRDIGRSVPDHSMMVPTGKNWLSIDSDAVSTQRAVAGRSLAVSVISASMTGACRNAVCAGSCRCSSITCGLSASYRRPRRPCRSCLDDAVDEQRVEIIEIGVELVAPGVLRRLDLRLRQVVFVGDGIGHVTSFASLHSSVGDTHSLTFVTALQHGICRARPLLLRSRALRLLRLADAAEGFQGIRRPSPPP